MAQLKNLLVNGAARVLGKVYSPEFVGKLTGNADTATSATNDHGGTNIRSNYALYKGFSFSNDGNGIYLKSTAGAGTIATSATMPAATGSAWGVVTPGAQTFGGQKTFTGLIVSATGNNSGVKVGNTYITAIDGELIFQNNTSIRFGTSEWDYNKWAGLKYVPSTKTIYLGIPDGSIFTANSAQTGGTLMLPAIRYLSMNGKTAIDAVDSWLRVNEGKAFSSGVYFGSNIVRTDGQFQVADSGTKFKADSNGNGYFANNITIAGTCPLTFYGSGNGTYTLGCVYVKNSDGIIIEVPRATEAGDGKILALKVRTRGGQPAPEYAGDRLVETDFTYNLGSTTAEFAKGFIRAIAARHLDADAVYSNDHTLYIGYGSAAYTDKTAFYYSPSLSSRTQFAEINSNGLYALTRFGVNGQNTGYTFYVNGTSYFSGNIFPAGNVYIGPSGAGGYLNGSAANGGCNSIMVGDDVWLGDVNQGGIMGMKSTSGANAGFWFYNSSGTNTGKLYVDSSGNLFSNNNNLPLTNNTYNLGSSSYYWANSYVTSTHNNTVFLMDSGSSSATTSTPTALSYGRLQCYGTLAINGNTDNSGTEYVIITSGKGMSSSVADGLAIGTNTLTWQSRNIQTWNAPFLGTVDDYTRVVIALCKTSAASTALDSHCSGEIYTQRPNGLIPIYSAHFNFCSDYGVAQGANYSLFTNFENLSTAVRDGEGYRACTFTYNGVTYAGLEFAQTQACNFYYHGVGNFDPFIVAYYNWNSGSALNAEINNSLAYNKVTRQNFYLKGRATNSDYSEYIGNDSKYMRFHWNGQNGQPTWLWGGNNADNMYVYNPSNFRVANADTVDDCHETAFFRHDRLGVTGISGDDGLWGSTGSRSFHGVLPEGLSGIYNWGQLISFSTDNSGRLQIYAAHTGSSDSTLSYRTGWGTDKKTWRTFIDSGNIGSQSVNYATSAGNADTVDGQHASAFATAGHTHAYLPIAGGTMTGPLNFANGTYNVVGDDVAIGDINVGGCLGIRGLNGNTNIRLVQYGASTTSGTGAPGVSWTCTGNGTSTISGTLSGTFSGNLSGNASSATRAADLSSYSSNPTNSHPGYGARIFYSWNIGNTGSDSEGYSTGITIGSHPSDPNYGFQLVQNLWDDRLYTRRYNAGWQSWKTLAWTSDIPTSLPANGGNSDTVDGYHASSLWRADGATWNPNANVSLTASDNNQEWSFDIRRNGKTGCYWHVWDSSLLTMLKVNADDGKVSAPYNFVGKLEGTAKTLARSGDVNGPMTFNWNGQGGQPTWLWGGNDGSNMYVYNPSNFSVNYATSSAYTNRLNNNGSTASTDPGGLTWNNLDGSVVGAVADRNDTPTGAWWYILRNRHTNTQNDYYTDLALPFNDNGIYYKIVRGGRVANGGWVKVIDQFGGTIRNEATYTPLTISSSAKEASICYHSDVAGYNWIVGPGAGSATPNNFGFYNSSIGYIAHIDAWGNAAFNGNITSSTIYTSNWFRSTGQTGWYSESYGGGWYMTDSTWLRTYNSKSIYSGSGVIRSDAGFQGIKGDQSEINIDLQNSACNVRFTAAASGKAGIYDVKSSKWLLYTYYSYGKINFDNHVQAVGIYNNTCTYAANMHIASDGDIHRTTSASKYKLDIKDIHQPNTYAYNLLKLKPRQWFDKNATERYAKLMTDIYTNNMDEKTTDYSELKKLSLEPCYGLVAEEVKKAGLEEFCVYGPIEDGKEKEIEGIQYERLPILMIPILRDLVNSMKIVIPQIKDKIEDKDLLEQINELQNKFNSFDNTQVIDDKYDVEIKEKITDDAN